MTIINITATITVIMTLAAIDPPTIAPIEVELGVLVLVLVGLVLAYTSVHSESVVPFSETSVQYILQYASVHTTHHSPSDVLALFH